MEVKYKLAIYLEAPGVSLGLLQGSDRRKKGCFTQLLCQELGNGWGLGREVVEAKGNRVEWRPGGGASGLVRRRHMCGSYNTVPEICKGLKCT